MKKKTTTVDGTKSKCPKTKYSKLENAPKANPPTQRSQNSHGGHIAQAQDVDGEPENDDEIKIMQSETCRMKIITINVRSAVSDRKKSQIRAGIKRIYPDVVVITESWFGDHDQEFRVENYEPIGRPTGPRTTTKKEGVEYLS